MWKRITFGWALALFASAAFAFSCPTLVSEIDTALSDDAVVAELSDAELEEVRTLRDRGEALHNQGDHNESEAVLHEARAILGLD